MKKLIKDLIFNHYNNSFSSSGFTGLLLIIVGVILLIISFISYIFYNNDRAKEIIDTIFWLILTGSSLLGVRKIINKPCKNENEENIENE